MSDIVKILRRVARERSRIEEMPHEETHQWRAADEIERLREELESVVNEVMPYSPSEQTPNAAGQPVSTEPSPSEMVAEILGRWRRR